MSDQLIIVGGFTISLIGLFGAFQYRNETRMNSFLRDLRKRDKDESDKRARIYARFDEHKEKVKTILENEYVRKDLFALQHDHLEKDIRDIEQKVDVVIAEIKQLSGIKHDINLLMKHAGIIKGDD